MACITRLTHHSSAALVAGDDDALSGAALIMPPSSTSDFKDPYVKKIIDLAQRAAKMEPEEKVKFIKAAWDAIGSEFGSRIPNTKCPMPAHVLPPPARACRTYDRLGAAGMVDIPMNSYQLANELPTKSS